MTVLAISPHLDDAAFSAGGTLAALSASGAAVTVATVFTATVPSPTGFALACQTDKGIAPEADYMALRREEDAAACEVLGAEAVWLGLPEAPHRGYHTAGALFSDIHTGDERTWRDVLVALRALVEARRPDVVLSCQGLGGHVDHRHVVRAVAALADATGCPVAWWRDTPYAMRQPDAAPAGDLPAGLLPLAIPLAEAHLAAKLDACAAYATQLPYQFARDADGDPADLVRQRMAAFAREEGRRNQLAAAETFAADPDACQRVRALLSQDAPGRPVG